MTLIYEAMSVAGVWSHMFKLELTEVNETPQFLQDRITELNHHLRYQVPASFSVPAIPNPSFANMSPHHLKYQRC